MPSCPGLPGSPGNPGAPGMPLIPTNTEKCLLCSAHVCALYHV